MGTAVILLILGAIVSALPIASRITAYVQGKHHAVLAEHRVGGCGQGQSW